MKSRRSRSAPTKQSSSFASAVLTRAEFTVPIPSSYRQTLSSQRKATMSTFQSKVRAFSDFCTFQIIRPVSALFFIGFISLELPITIHLDIDPENDVYEGDQLNILCKVINSEHSHESVRLLLIQGTQILRSGVTNVSHSMVAQANDPEEFECKLEMGNVVKTATKRISVIGEWREERCLHSLCL